MALLSDGFRDTRRAGPEFKVGSSGLRVGSPYRLWYLASSKEGDDAGHRVVRDVVESGQWMAGS